MSSRSAPSRSLLSIDDLSEIEIDALLDRARQLIGGSTTGVARHSFVAGLIFQSSSLRTKVGFTVATARLGGVAVDVNELRHDSAMSSSETFPDTLRVVQGMVDITVTRTVGLLAELARTDAVGPIINAGEAGGEHPTQALIDLLAIEEESGSPASLRIGLCGDLGARSARSLVKLLARRSPASLVLMAPEGRELPDGVLSNELAGRTERYDHLRCTDLDVLYLVGLPEGTDGEALPSSVRSRFRFAGQAARALAPTAVVLSPMPVIDEIAPEVRSDPRLRMFAESDRGVAVRMACLELCLGLVA